MSVFRNYNNQKAGQVNANALPRMYSHPWTPTQQNVRANPNIPSQPQRIQPHERGTFFPTSASAGGTLAPQMSTTGCSGCGCGGGAGTPTVTASDAATSHSFPSTAAIKAAPRPVIPRPQPRSTGALRSALRDSSSVSLSANRSMVGRQVR